MSGFRPNWQAVAGLVAGLASLIGLPFTATMDTGASLLVAAIVVGASVLSLLKLRPAVEAVILVEPFDDAAADA